MLCRSNLAYVLFPMEHSTSPLDFEMQEFCSSESQAMLRQASCRHKHHRTCCRSQAPRMARQLGSSCTCASTASLASPASSTSVQLRPKPDPSSSHERRRCSLCVQHSQDVRGLLDGSIAKDLAIARPLSRPAVLTSTLTMPARSIKWNSSHATGAVDHFLKATGHFQASHSVPSTPSSFHRSIRSLQNSLGQDSPSGTAECCRD